MLIHMRRSIKALLLLLPFATAAWRGQVPGYAEISSPIQGQSLSGVVTIQGTASHPSFQSYGVSFAYDPNPTGTWFEIGQPSTTSVNDGRLAVWDTSGLTPGTYQLRLTVRLENGNSLESTVGGLRVGRQPTPGAPSAATLATSTPAVLAQAVPAAGLEGPGQTEGAAPEATLIQVLKIGAISAVAALLLLGAYAALRPRIRVYLGSIQNRQLDPRRRSRRRGRRP
jgi:hypothetical protein